MHKCTFTNLRENLCRTEQFLLNRKSENQKIDRYGWQTLVLALSPYLLVSSMWLGTVLFIAAATGGMKSTGEGRTVSAAIFESFIAVATSVV